MAIPASALTTWLPIITAIMGGGLIAAITALAKVLLDHKRQKRGQSDGVALSLVETLSQEVKELRGEVVRERDSCAGRIERLELQSDQDRKTNEALDMLRRHQVANSKSALHMTIDLIEVAPDRLEQIIPRIRKRLEEHDATEARDKAAFMAARFGGVLTPIPVEDNPA